ncbi:WD repeat-containing protein [Nitzschia inconspicua]|uniref:WD repeat-containing protein n=1 Tax=Nitzschia inconspicua TaxID=303405 RepID=A0A9K3L9W4_9STRA|nr:WD repeat-containing protein [Nitzschia inconspicua]
MRTALASSSTQIVSSMHQDYIHDCKFDIYGRRMATCSGDRFVRVWDFTDSGEWTLVGEWQAHKASVSMLSWGHPEFGSLIATCGNDNEAKIWEERTSHSASSRWTAKAQLTEARKAVSCVEFAPRHWGLKLATGSADGCVRIYEAVDVLNLAQWANAATLQCFSDGNGVTSLSWSTGRFEPPTLVVGGSHPVVYRYTEASRQWSPVLVLPPPSHGDVRDVAWAPNVGRRFHYIASCEGEQLRIFKLSRGSSSGEGDSLDLEATQTIELPNAWRCQWNVTGTVLAVGGDRGTVQLYKLGSDGSFQIVSQIQGDLSQVAAHRSM